MTITPSVNKGDPKLPKELYDKFDEFLGLLFELNKVRAALHDHLNQKVAGTLDMISSEGGLTLKGDHVNLWISVRFDPDDDYKVLERRIISLSRLWRNTDQAMDILSGYIDQLNGGKIPEPEVLLVTDTPNGKKYCISKEWLKWYTRIFPYSRQDDGALEAATLQAAKKHFSTGVEDRIERKVISQHWWQDGVSPEVEFYRVTREKL